MPRPLGRISHRPLGGFGGRVVRFTQAGVEVLAKVSAPARLTQLAAEVVYGGVVSTNHPARVTQLTMEVIHGGVVSDDEARVTQISAEIIHDNATYTTQKDADFRWNVTEPSSAVILNWAEVRVPRPSGAVAPVTADQTMKWHLCQSGFAAGGSNGGWTAYPIPPSPRVGPPHWLNRMALTALNSGADLTQALTAYFFAELIASSALREQIDEPYPPIDSDFIYSPYNPSAAKAKIKLASFGDPATSDFHIIEYRIGRFPRNVTTQVTLTVRLVQGTTVIASWVHENVQADYITFTRTLTAAQADSISDYTDLYLEFEAE